MAIIKCPECGRQISDKAPVCPNCGVEIAGKIMKCPQCGEIYFRDQEMCPNCHHLTRSSGQAAQGTNTRQAESQGNGGQIVSPNAQATTTKPNGQPATNRQPTPPPVKPQKSQNETANKKKKKNFTITGVLNRKMIENDEKVKLQPKKVITCPHCK